MSAAVPRRVVGCAHLSVGAVALLALVALGSGPAASALTPTVAPGAGPVAGRAAAPAGSSYGWVSDNWSGYAVTTTGSYRSVSGSWTVPTVSTATTGYSVTWVGLDGFANTSIIQAGTTQNSVDGASSYRVWWTTSAYDHVGQPIDEPVAPGDLITVGIVHTAGGWTITVTDATQAWQWISPSLSYSGPADSAEWITEDPTSHTTSNLLPFADYGTVTFTGARVDGANPELVAGDAGALEQAGRLLSVPSLPRGGNSFTDAYGSSRPPPPA